jgi:hypothetical protein
MLETREKYEQLPESERTIANWDTIHTNLKYQIENEMMDTYRPADILDLKTEVIATQ